MSLLRSTGYEEYERRSSTHDMIPAHYTPQYFCAKDVHLCSEQEGDAVRLEVHRAQ